MVATRLAEFHKSILSLAGFRTARVNSFDDTLGGGFRDRLHPALGFLRHEIYRVRGNRCDLTGGETEDRTHESIH